MHWPIHMLIDPTVIILMHAPPRIVIYWIQDTVGHVHKREYKINFLTENLIGQTKESCLLAGIGYLHTYNLGSGALKKFSEI